MRDLYISSESNVTFLDCNLEESSLWDEYGYYRTKDYEDKFDSIYIYHFASPVGVVNHKESTFYRAMYINQNVYHFAKNFQIFTKPINSKERDLKFFYMSSSEIYGPINENTLTPRLDTFANLHENLGGFRSDYIYQKVLGEELFRQLPGRYGVVILRLFNIVGKYQDPTKGVFNKFIDNIVHNLVCEINDSIRSYTPYSIFTETMFAYIFRDVTGIVTTNVCSPDFGLSMTTEELYMYLHQYLITHYNCISGENKNFTYINMEGEIKYRGSTNTISYREFVNNFGWIIDEYMVWAHTEKSRKNHIPEVKK